MLDGKQITDNSRQFLMSWKASREAQQREKSRPDFNDETGDYPNQNGELINRRISMRILWTQVDDSDFSFCLSSNYSSETLAGEINDHTPNARSVTLLPYRLMNGILLLCFLCEFYLSLF
jgi:hypothetical protein